MASSVAMLEKHAFVVDQAGELRSFAMPGLKAGQSWQLDASSITYGPARLGEHLLLATDRDELWCFDDEPKQLWKIPLKHGALAGWPTGGEGELIFPTKSGVLWRIEEATGKELASVDLFQPLAGDLAALEDSLLVPTADGTLLKVSLPAQGASAP
jgi:hypothetical protein